MDYPQKLVVLGGRRRDGLLGQLITDHGDELTVDRERQPASSCRTPIAGPMASQLLYGVPSAVPIPDLNRTDLLVVMGANPVVLHAARPPRASRTGCVMW